MSGFGQTCMVLNGSTMERAPFDYRKREFLGSRLLLCLSGVCVDGAWQRERAAQLRVLPSFRIQSLSAGGRTAVLRAGSHWPFQVVLLKISRFGRLLDHALHRMV